MLNQLPKRHSQNRRQTKHQTSQFTKLLKLEILKRSSKALAAGVEVNAKDEGGWTPFYVAKNKEFTELLIENGANVNAKDKDGYTPLDWATQRNHPETADLLRKHGGKTKEELKTEGK